VFANRVLGIAVLHYEIINGLLTMAVFYKDAGILYRIYKDKPVSNLAKRCNNAISKRGTSAYVPPGESR
jgi:hypothetical protein